VHFMVLILVFLLGAVLWGFFHANPAGVPRGRLLAVNLAVLAAGLAAAGLVGPALLADGLQRRPDEAGMAWFLALMGGGTAFMIVVSAGGLLRNLVLFPISRRANR
jgi:hypothetical protein